MFSSSGRTAPACQPLQMQRLFCCEDQYEMMRNDDIFQRIRPASTITLSHGERVRAERAGEGFGASGLHILRRLDPLSWGEGATATGSGGRDLALTILT